MVGMRSTQSNLCNLSAHGGVMYVKRCMHGSVDEFTKYLICLLS
jgi:hypothetical protein